jgi:cell division protein FtsB
MKKKPKQSLSALQQKRLIKISVVFLLAALVWLLFAPDMGFFSWRQQSSKFEELQQQKVKLQQENSDLRQEIERIQTDIDYFERLAREKHGLLRKNEMLFDFSKEEKEE